MTIIKRTLKGTNFQVTLELDEVQYAHLCLVEGRRARLQMPLDINVATDMVDLAAHFETERTTGEAENKK